MAESLSIPQSIEPSAAQKVFRGIMRELEHQRIVTGQRLVETELAERFSVGRNAVREAMQLLAARGVVELSPNRSSKVRKLDRAETEEVLDVAEVMTGLTGRLAARQFARSDHAPRLTKAIEALAEPELSLDPAMFSAARRQFYRALLAVAGNRELDRLFPAIGMHIIYSQFQSARLRDMRLADYGALFDAVVAGDEAAAEAAARGHVNKVRAVIRELSA